VSFAVSNNGNTLLRDLVLTLPTRFSGSATCSGAMPAALAVGGTLSCSSSVPLTLEDLEAGSLVVSATASASNLKPAATSSLNVAVAPAPQLQVTVLGATCTAPAKPGEEEDPFGCRKRHTQSRMRDLYHIQPTLQRVLFLL
jgi:hypothetical protein